MFSEEMYKFSSAEAYILKHMQPMVNSQFYAAGMRLRSLVSL